MDETIVKPTGIQKWKDIKSTVWTEAKKLTVHQMDETIVKLIGLH